MNVCVEWIEYILLLLRVHVCILLTQLSDYSSSVWRHGHTIFIASNWATHLIILPHRQKSNTHNNKQYYIQPFLAR